MLVILTDGYVNDMSQTLELIVDLSVLPASLIIAGIGKEDFSQMDVLNAETLTDEAKAYLKSQFNHEED